MGWVKWPFSRHRKPETLRTVPPNRKNIVKRDHRSFVDRRNWRPCKSAWVGEFLTPGGSYVGMIELRNGCFFFYVLNFPIHVLQKHPHSACVSILHDGWVRVHIQDQPCDGDPSAVLRYAERFLREAQRRASVI